MSTLRDWLHNLKLESEKDEPRLLPNHGRLVSPGLKPLEYEGFFRIEAKSVVNRMGSSPESFSVAQWLDVQSDSLGDLPTLLSASLTLIADRRIEILPEAATPIQGTDRILFIPYSSIPDKRIINPIDSTLSDSQVRKLFTQIGSLNIEDDETITQAISLHYASTLLFDRDLPAAYALLVAGLEALSTRYGDPKTKWEDWDLSDTWDTFITKQNLNDNQGSALRTKLIKDKKMRLGDTFARYVSSSLPETFWTNTQSTYTYSIESTSGTWVDGNWESANTFEKLVPKDRDIVYKALRKSYDSRSKYVHEGKRAITPLTEIQGLSNMMTGDDAVPYALLRTMLTSLIKIELTDHSTDNFILPKIKLSHRE